MPPSALYSGSTMNGSSTWLIAIVTPATLPVEHDVAEAEELEDASAPGRRAGGCTIQAKLRAMTEVQNGMSTITSRTPASGARRASSGRRRDSRAAKATTVTMTAVDAVRSEHRAS